MNYRDSSTNSINKYYDGNTTGQPDTRIMDDSGSFDGDVEQLFTKKEKPTIDDVVAGMQYELQNMVQKDKRVAKARVIDNLKKFGSKYYTKLHMLNIDDTDMAPQMKERLNILNKMVSEKEEKRKDLRLNDAIQDILREKREQKFAKSDCLIKLTK
jgi:DNA-directed RNA polymerase beta' subunit